MHENHYISQLVCSKLEFGSPISNVLHQTHSFGCWIRSKIIFEATITSYYSRDSILPSLKLRRVKNGIFYFYIIFLLIKLIVRLYSNTLIFEFLTFTLDKTKLFICQLLEQIISKSHMGALFPIIFMFSQINATLIFILFSLWWEGYRILYLAMFSTLLFVKLLFLFKFSTVIFFTVFILFLFSI